MNAANSPASLRYLRRQSGEVLRGGAPVLLRKALSLATLLLAPLLVALVRLIRPLVTVRFGKLISTRIGHFAVNTELYMCEREVGMQPRRTLDFFYNGATVCNQQLETMWRRRLRVHQLAARVDRLNRRLPGYQRHVVQLPVDDDKHRLLSGTSAHLSFTREEHRRGQAALQELGVPEGGTFVCFHARDSAYLTAMHDYRSRDDWAYHDYRDADVETYLPAVEEMTLRSHFAIRMGSVVKNALNLSNPMVIDYPRVNRSEFMDIFLGGNCRFFIADSAGLGAVPKIFRRPLVYANTIPIGPSPLLTHGPGSLHIPKKLWLRDEHRFMTFREVIDSGAAGFYRTEKYEAAGLEIVNNSPKEIAAVVVEMDERLNGTWSTTDEDEELQRRLRALFAQEGSDSVPDWRMGAEFLRQNQELLD